MIEESTESFTSRWRKHATEARIFARVENDPLLELETGGVIMHALERTGPYIPVTGTNRVILHALAESVTAAGDAGPALEVTGISRARLTGSVVQLEEPLLVVDAGLPVVVGCLHGIPAGITEGDTVTFTALPPLQVFVLEQAREAAHDHEV